MTKTKPETARLTGDVVLLAEHDGELHVLLIERGWPPYEGCWALPGGHVDEGEEIEAAALRELVEETGLATAQLNLVGVYGAPGRDPRGRYVTWAYTAMLDNMPEPTAGDDARVARWMPVSKMLADPDSLAFDHHQILTDVLAFHDRAGGLCPSRIGDILCCLPTWHTKVPEVRQHAWSDGKRFATWDGE